MSAETMERITKKLAERSGTATAGAPISILSFGDMCEPSLTAKGLVKGVIDAETLVLMYGEPGCGKTFLALDLALSIADGREWLGHKVRRSRVVYVAAEAGTSIRNRVSAWQRHRWTGDDEIDFRAVVSPVNLCHPRGNDVHRLAEAIGAADVVVIDTVSRALAGGDENSPGDMGAFVATLDRLRSDLRCTVIAIHHVGKDASRGARGHSLLRCAVDTEIAVERRDEGICVAEITKQRDGPSGEEFAFRLRAVELGYDQDRDPVTSCIVEPEDHVPAAKVKGPTGQAKAALDILNMLMAEKGELRDLGGSPVRAVHRDTWREAMQQSGDFGEKAVFRNAFMRAQARLQDGGHITLHRGDWLTVTGPELPAQLPF